MSSTEDSEDVPFTHDLRVDATETPIADLQEVYELAGESFKAAMERAADEDEDED